MSWEKGFEAGVAFTLRHFIVHGITSHAISEFISKLEHLRTWKTPEEWRELVVKNIRVEDEDG